ncbi:hypothetical protein OTU49_004964, partial [Cherax quadricarinatus]
AISLPSESLQDYKQGPCGLLIAGTCVALPPANEELDQLVVGDTLQPTTQPTKPTSQPSANYPTIHCQPPRTDSRYTCVRRRGSQVRSLSLSLFLPRYRSADYVYLDQCES